jgi:hypothetical protein
MTIDRSAYTKLYKIYTISEVESKFNTELKVTQHEDGHYMAYFKYVEIKEGGMLASRYGIGITPIDAINDYITKIRGRNLVSHAYSEDERQEFICGNIMIEQLIYNQCKEAME